MKILLKGCIILDFPLFSTTYYHYVTQSGLKLRRYCLCYSQARTVFTVSPAGYFLIKMSPGTSYALQNPWGTTGLNDWRHLSQRIRSHESSAHHAEACVIYEQWRNKGTIEKALHESLLKKTNFWQNVLERLVNVTLMLAKCNLLFRGSREEFSKDNKGNFLSFIQLLAKYDTFRQAFTTT